ncbi:MAG: DUF177 domain-containing protein [Bdellovibrionales bacterium]
MSDTAKHEFSRPLNADRVNVGQPRTENISANEAERAALAERFGLLALDKLTATLNITRLPDSPAIVLVEGRLHAMLTQACVVTLEPLPVHVNEEFSTELASPEYIEKYLAEHGEEDLDAPEAIEHGHIDLGEIVAQYLALALDPYPRKEGLPEPTEEAPLDEARQNPFAVLASLKKEN